jgi:hypothetical protein
MATVRDILCSYDVWAALPGVVRKPAAVTPLCWHCCHSFDSPAIGFPVRYDARKRSFTVAGQFCSWPCLKGYNRDSFASFGSGMNEVNIAHYHSAITGRKRRVTSAPPRPTLRAFGGHLDIEDFRAATTAPEDRRGDRDVAHAPRASVFRLPVFFIGPAAYAGVGGDASVAARRTAVVPEGPLDFADVARPCDTLRLRRPTPLAVGQNKLERALGLNALL